MVSMGNSLNGFVVAAAAALVAKYFFPSKRVLIDAALVLGVMVGLMLNLSQVLKDRCGEGGGGAFQAVVFPWVFMVGSVLALLHYYPGWKQPFSNTFGYLAIQIPGMDARSKMLKLVPEGSLRRTIETDPSLLLNEFTTQNFEQQAATLSGGKLGEVDPSGEYRAAFRKVVDLKELVAEFMWTILAGCVALITSFNLIMNTPCA